MSAADQPSDAAERLIQGWIDQTLEARDQAELERWLADAPDHRRRFLLSLHLHHQLGQSPAAQARQRPARRPRLRRRSARTLAIALAVAAMLMAGVGIWLSTMVPPHDADRNPPSRQSTVGMPIRPAETGLYLSSATSCARIRAGARTSAAGETLLAEDALETGPGGSAVVLMRDGTRLDLGADARLEIPSLGPGGAIDTDPADRADVRLMRGTLECEVVKHEASSPLCLATQNALVHVIGTHLLIASDGRDSSVAVTRGRVAVKRPGSSQGIELSAGQSGLVAATGPIAVRGGGEPWGRLLRVGPGEAIPALAQLPALAPGDVVELAAGSYREARRWIESGTALCPIVVRAEKGAKVLIDGTGVDVSGVGAVPRALFQLEGAHMRIEGIAFAHAANHRNGAGVRLLTAKDIAIVGCTFSECDDGICGEGDGIRIEACRISACGTAEHEGYCHDCFVDGGSSLVITGSVLIDARHGQALKCAAHRILIEGCRLGLSQDGEISILDPPDGSRPEDEVDLIGDCVLSLPERTGNHRRFIEVDAENGHPRAGRLVLAYDTLVAVDPRTRLIDITQGAMRCVAVDNILVGTDPLISGGTGDDGVRNWLPAGAQAPAGWQRSIFGADAGPGFRAQASGDVRLRDDASAADAAVPLQEVPAAVEVAPPAFQPPLSDHDAPVPRTGWRDLGAFEHDSQHAIPAGRMSP
jgi:ferric-dicitrate binding protein FerR (iron transport regulator)